MHGKDWNCSTLLAYQTIINFFFLISFPELLFSSHVCLHTSTEHFLSLFAPCIRQYSKFLSPTLELWSPARMQDKTFMLYVHLTLSSWNEFFLPISSPCRVKLRVARLSAFFLPPIRVFFFHLLAIRMIESQTINGNDEWEVTQAHSWLLPLFSSCKIRQTDNLKSENLYKKSFNPSQPTWNQ